MNKILIGLVLLLITVSCGVQNQASQEKIIKDILTSTEVVETEGNLKAVEEERTLEVIDSIESDTSIYNQYKNGKKEGLWKEVNKKGALLTQGYYKNGKANGWMKWYHEGVLAAEGNMIEGKRNGPWKICYIDDLLICIDANFEHESREGLWKTYYANGKLHKQQTWKNDQIIFEECWDENAKPIACQ